MNIIFNRSSEEYEWCWSNSLGNLLLELPQEDDGLCLCYGAKTLTFDENYFIDLKKKYSKIAFLDFSQSSFFLDPNFDQKFKNLKLFSHFFSNNQHTVTAFKKTLNFENISYIKVGFPIKEKKYNQFINVSSKSKKFDLIYSGGIYSKFHFDMLKIMKDFNYIFSSFYKQNFFGKFTWNPFFRIKQKRFEDHNKIIELQSQTKAAICNFENYIPDNYNKRFKKIKEKFNFGDTIPELKGRFFELAATKTLMIVKRDKWNIIEEYFVPNEDFIYFTTIDELKEKIFNILHNYENYWPLIESAYNKIISNSPEIMIKNIKKTLLNN